MSRTLVVFAFAVMAALAFTACSPAAASEPSPAPSEYPTTLYGSEPTSAPLGQPTLSGAAPTEASGAPTTEATTGPSSSEPTTEPATGAAPYAEGTATSSTSGSGATGDVFPLKMVSNSALGEILTDNRGMTLYINKNDTPVQSTCTGTCAQNWPPLTISNGGQASLDPSVTGKLGTLALPDGTNQVTFNGMPLYYYGGDQQPGDANGQGVNGIWAVVSSAGTSGAGTTTPSTPSASPTGTQ
ncbi:MAG: hypothetical protein M1482_00240 [Chloroflexi bacterium]|nr:hypothetical protein [Chloroflexota bacterium]